MMRVVEEGLTPPSRVWLLDSVEEAGQFHNARWAASWCGVVTVLWECNVKTMNRGESNRAQYVCPSELMCVLSM